VLIEASSFLVLALRLGGLRETATIIHDKKVKKKSLKGGQHSRARLSIALLVDVHRTVLRGLPKPKMHIKFELVSDNDGSDLTVSLRSNKNVEVCRHY